MIDRFTLVLKEIMNGITNLASALMPIVMIVLEICGVSEEVLTKIKDVEWKLFEAYGTKNDLEK